MKMNTLAALKTVAVRSRSAAGQAMLEAFKPRVYAETVGGRSMAQAGCEPILHMRAFQKTKVLPPDLVADIGQRHGAPQ
jgi:quinolinate synthase